VIANVDGDLRLYIGSHFEVQVQRDEIEKGMPWADCFTGEGVHCIFLSRVVQDVDFQRDAIEVPLPGEVSWRSYYLAGGVRIAMRTVTEGEAPAGVVTYLLGDHLNSTSVSVDGAAPECRQGTSRGMPGFRRTRLGNPIGTLHYKPFGEVREAVGETPTDYTYIPHSGHRPPQREEADFGLHYYVARW
jgi:hypothetical protein